MRHQRAQESKQKLLNYLAGIFLDGVGQCSKR